MILCFLDIIRLVAPLNYAESFAKMRDCCNGVFHFETQIVLLHFLLLIVSPLNKIQI